MRYVRRAAAAAAVAIAALSLPMAVDARGPGPREIVGAGSTKSVGKELVLPDPLPAEKPPRERVKPVIIEGENGNAIGVQIQ